MERQISRQKSLFEPKSAATSRTLAHVPTGGKEEPPTKIRIPLPLQAEHEELHAELAALQKSPGHLGAAARDLAVVLHSHFVKEERFALPPLGLLPTVASGNITAEMAAVTAMTDNLRAELPRLLQEHKRIAAGVKMLVDAAEHAGDMTALRFGEKLLTHARTEELLLYPAAIVLGDWVRHCIQQVKRPV